MIPLCTQMVSLEQEETKLQWILYNSQPHYIGYQKITKIKKKTVNGFYYII